MPQVGQLVARYGIDGYPQRQHCQTYEYFLFFAKVCIGTFPVGGGNMVPSLPSKPYASGILIGLT